MPTFPEFYQALNERMPFPWQARLADQVAESNHWPTEIGIPTGLGKTACLDIAVWWLASQAEWPPAERTAPTRIWWLVNRRLLVDSTADHARRISETLRDSNLRPLRVVGDRLRSQAAVPSAPPLEVIRLRGGVGAQRPTDPSSPAVLLSTIPMYGSRLLFRGYGTSRTMRSVDAALAGSDSLLLVDEAHLAPHLTNLVSTLAECTKGAKEILGESRSRPQVVALSATGDAAEGDRFDLNADDEGNAIVRQRLDASKPVETRVHSSGDPVHHLAQAAEDLLKAAPPSSCLVFANTPDTARGVFTLLRKRFPASAADTLLLTGRTREREADLIRAQILDGVEGMAANRNPGAARSRHLIVVATQTLEVGADIDAEYLVTETCGVRALTQRLGRLNRLGYFEHARGVYVHAPPKNRGARKRKAPAEWPVYGTEPDAVLERLKNSLDPAKRSVDLSPRTVSEILGEPRDDPGRAPEILNGLLWEWVKTTTPPLEEAPVEPYFSGISGIDYSVSVIWRAHIPNVEQHLWPRPFDSEVVNVPIGAIKGALGEDGEVKRLRTDRITIESIPIRELRPGDVVLLPSDRGLLDEFGWNPDSNSPVFDVSIAVRGLPLDEEAIQRMGGVSLTEPFETASGNVPLRSLLRKALGHVPDEEETDEAERQEAADQFLQAMFETTPAGWEEAEWRDFLEALEPRVVFSPNEVPRFRLPADGRTEQSSEELDETSLAPTAVLLDTHGAAVGITSRSIAEQVGITSELVNVIQQAGRWHDCGKADPRFQRWLNPHATATNGRASPMLAKSRIPRNRWNVTRVAAGWPRGGRHEALSARLIRRWIETFENDFESCLADLLVHLVVSHHGSGRPLIPPVIDGASEKVVSEIEGVRLEASADLSVVDWEQPARFRRLNERYGPWGLALMETILRMADHAVSSSMSIPAVEARP